MLIQAAQSWFFLPASPCNARISTPTGALKILKKFLHKGYCFS